MLSPNRDHFYKFQNETILENELALPDRSDPMPVKNHSHLSEIIFCFRDKPDENQSKFHKSFERYLESGAELSVQKQVKIGTGFDLSPENLWITR